MSIEESIGYLKLKIKNDNLTIQGMFGDIYEEIRKDNTAIETLLTAYEKEKEINKKLNILRLELIISQFPDTTETYKKYKKELDELLKEE